MAGWNSARAAVVGGAAVAVAWAVVALAAPAQNPIPIPQPMPPAELKFYPETPTAPKTEPEALPPLKLPSIYDENVEQAGLKQPA